MRTADGGGYGGEGNWAGRDVRALWPLLASQETSAHWRQVEGWRKACDLTSTHLSRLKGYRENLAAVWPPERSAAARAYLDRLDFLIDTVARTYEAAVANHDTFRAATLAIDDSRQRLRQIHDEYVASEEIKRGHEVRLAANPAAQLTDVPPVTDADLERLNIHARRVMAGLSNELSLAQVRLTQPPKYQSRPGITQEPTTYEGVTNGSPPIIPPIVPIAGGAQLLVARQAPPASTRQTVPLPTAPRGGPVLGIANILAPPPTSDRSKSDFLIPSNATNESAPRALSPSSTAYTSRGVVTDRAPGTIAAKGSTPASIPANASHTATTNGIVGNTPAAGAQQTMNKTTPSRHVTPTNGIISGSATNATFSTAARARSFHIPETSATPTIAVPKSNQRTEMIFASTTDTGQSDPDYPWATPQGTSPVVYPSDNEHKIHPGSAIGFRA